MLVLLVGVLPFFQQEIEARELLRMVLSLVFMAALYASTRRRRDVVYAGLLVAPALIGRWLPQHEVSETIQLVVALFTAAFLAYVTAAVLSQVLRPGRVTYDTISGAICAYFLIGLTWSFLYLAIDLGWNNAFVVAGAPASLGSVELIRLELQRLIYYSFVTLTTLGYGDIIPSIPPARALSMLEAIAGQMYVAILIARLVGLHIIHSEREHAPETKHDSPTKRPA